MKAIKQYDIDIFGLANKEYSYDFESGDSFFVELEQDLINSGSFKTHVVLDKSTTMIRLDITVSGVVELECDRSLELFEEPFDTEGRLFLKFGDHDEELTEEIEIINRNTTRINLARYIYDFIALALPVKRLHPKFRTEDDEDEETEFLVYSSGVAYTENDDEEQSNEAPVDPRWEALKKIK